MTSPAEFVYPHNQLQYFHPITGELFTWMYWRASCTVTYHRFHECLMIHGHQQFGKQIQIEDRIRHLPGAARVHGVFVRSGHSITCTETSRKFCFRPSPSTGRGGGAGGNWERKNTGKKTITSHITLGNQLCTICLLKHLESQQARLYTKIWTSWQSQRCEWLAPQTLYQRWK